MTVTEMKMKTTLKTQCGRSSFALPAPRTSCLSMTLALLPLYPTLDSLTRHLGRTDELLCRAEDAVIQLKPESLEVFQCMRSGEMTNKEIAEKFDMTQGIIDRFVRMRRQELERIQEVNRQQITNPSMRM